MSEARITVLVEDSTAREDLAAEHGFAAWVETGRGRVLFDTGQGGALLPNAAALGVDLSLADAVVISHGHYDHTGALMPALDRCGGVRLFVHPDALEEKYSVAGGTVRRIGIGGVTEEDLRSHPAVEELVLTAEGREVVPGVFTTGQVPRVSDFEDTGGPFFLDPGGREPDVLADDVSLYIETAHGLVVVLGCAHAGVVNILRHVLELSGRRDFHAVFGGMHLGSASDERLRATLDFFRKLGVDRVGPCHCTGERAVAAFRREFPDSFFDCHPGSVVEV